MRKTPFVSVIVPTYNHARFLGRALQSVIEQTHITWEVIIVDNHSTDNTSKVIASFSDPRLTHLLIQNGGKIAMSRNAGLRKAKGEWIAFLDSDDWWNKDKLQSCLAVATKSVDVIYHDLELVSYKRNLRYRRLIESWQVKPPVVRDLLVRGNALATSSVVVRTSLLKSVGGMNENADMIGAEDYNAWLRIAKLTERFKYLPRTLGYYQLHDQGVSQKDMSEPAAHAVADYVDLLIPGERNKVFANLRYAKGRFRYIKGDRQAARQDLLFSCRYGRPIVRLKSLFMLVCLVVEMAVTVCRKAPFA